MAETTTTKKVPEKVSFTHYQTGEVREVNKPSNLMALSRDFITAFMTSAEHCEDLPWYREMRDSHLAATKEANPNDTEGDIQIKAFRFIRKDFAAKYFPDFVKEKAPKPAKPAKLSLWDI